MGLLLLVMALGQATSELNGASALPGDAPTGSAGTAQLTASVDPVEWGGDPNRGACYQGEALFTTDCYAVYVDYPEAPTRDDLYAYWDYGNGLRALTLACDAYPDNLRAKPVWLGYMSHSDPFLFLPRGEGWAGCRFLGHQGLTVTFLGTSLHEVHVDASACGARCPVLAGGFCSRGCQFEIELEAPAGYRYLEEHWIGSGDECEEEAPTQCFALFVALPNSAVAGGVIPVEDWTDDGTPRAGTPVASSTPACESSLAAVVAGSWAGVTCTGFKPGEEVAFRWDAMDGANIGRTVTSWNGRTVIAFEASARLVGNSRITATGMSSGKVAKSPVTVEAAAVEEP